MSVYQWLCVLGIPSLLAGLVTFIKLQIATNKAIKLGVQAVLRNSLLQAYEFYADRGYANYDEKSNVRNMYDQYEALGPNGIMEQKHEAFIRIPDRLPNNGGN
jgi:hypothetical protein